jgi:hypothetical protein
MGMPHKHNIVSLVLFCRLSIFNKLRQIKYQLFNKIGIFAFWVLVQILYLDNAPSENDGDSPIDEILHRRES